MSLSKQNEQDLILYFYNELNAAERARIEALLHTSAECKDFLQHLEQGIGAAPRQPLVEPDQETLDILRRAVSVRIASEIQPKTRKSFFKFLPIWAHHPVAQFGFTAALVTIGFLAGLSWQGTTQPPVQNATLDALLTANRNVQASNSNIDPYLVGIQKIKYDSQTGSVEIYYNLR